MKVKSKLTKEINEAFKKFDLLIAPTVPIKPFKIGEKIDDPVSLFLVDINTVTANLTGKPVISIPFKIVNGLPIGIQLLANSMDDKLLLKARICIRTNCYITGGSNMTKIGLEIHCQLTNLESKLFCSCKANYREFEPNENICPVCAGMPGSLPRLNQEAVKKATMIAMALNCTTPPKIAFFRKKLFLSGFTLKNFQITQLNIYGDTSVGGFRHYLCWR